MPILWITCSVEHREKLRHWIRVIVKSNQSFGTKRKSFSIKTSWLNSLPRDHKNNPMFWKQVLLWLFGILYSCFTLERLDYCVRVPESVSVYLNEVCLQCNAKLTICAEKRKCHSVWFTVSGSFLQWKCCTKRIVNTS